MTQVFLVAFGSHRLILDPRVEHTRLVACVSRQRIGVVTLSMTLFFEAKSVILVWVLLPLRDDFSKSGLRGLILNTIPYLVPEELFEGQVFCVHFSKYQI